MEAICELFENQWHLALLMSNLFLDQYLNIHKLILKGRIKNSSDKTIVSKYKI